MKTVQNLYDELRSHRDVTMALTIQDAIKLLLKREPAYGSTHLGDNVIDLIIDELQSAIGEGRAATSFAVVNLLAPVDARAGSLNPVDGAIQFLNQLKTGQQTQIASGQ